MKTWLANRKARITLYIIAGFTFLLILLYWWFRFHVKDIIEQLVAYESKGKVAVKIGRMNIKLFHPPRLDLINTTFVVLDKSGKKISTKVTFSYLGLEIKSLRSIIFEKKLLVDFIIAENPVIEVSPENRKKGNQSVPFEIGNIYLAVEKITKTLEVKKFRIFNGSLGLKNLEPNNQSIVISGIEFNVDEFAFHGEKGKNTDEPVFVRNLELNTGRQNITFPEGNYNLKYSSLDISTKDMSITIDSCYIEGRSADTAYGTLEAGFSKLKLIHTDFRALYDSNKFKVDSIYCKDPVVRLKIDVTRKENNNQNQESSVEKTIAGLIGHLDVGYLGLINSDITITTKNKNKYRPFTTKGNNFEAYGIQIDSSKVNPIEIEKLVFAIKNYKTSSADSMYDVKFDSVVYNNHNLILKNFRLEPSEKNNHKDKKYVSIPDFELREISLAELITSQRLQAQELVLKNSRTINNYIPRSNAMRPSQPLNKIIDEINKKIDLDKVRIENGYMLSQSVTERTERIEVTGINSSISTNELLDAPSYEIMGYSIGRLTFDKASISTGNIRAVIEKGELYGKDKLVLNQKVTLTNLKNNTTVQIDHLRLKNYHFDDELEDVGLDSMTWKNARVSYHSIKQEARKDAEKTGDKKNLKIGYLAIRNTSVNFYTDEKVKGLAEISSINLKGFAADTDGKISLDDFTAEGSILELDMPKLSFRTGAFSFKEKQNSSLIDVNLDYHTDKDTARARIGKISMTPQIQESIRKKHPSFQQIEIENPVIFASLRPGVKIDGPGDDEKIFQFETGLFRLNNGKINFALHNENKSVKYITEYLDVYVNDVRIGKEKASISVGPFNMLSKMFYVNVNDSIELYNEKGKFEMAGNGLQLGSETDIKSFHTSISLIRIDSLNTSVINKKTGALFELNNFSVGGKDFRFDSADRRHLIRQIRNNPSLYARHINLARKTDLFEMAAFDIGFENAGRQLSLDSFYYRPVIDRDSFNRMNQFQKDYIQAKTGRIIIRNIDIEELLADTIFRASAIEINRPDLYIYKDKRLPFDFSKIKPLPVDMLKGLKFGINLDTILLKNGFIQYSEFNPKTQKVAVVDLPHTEAELTNIKNIDLGPTDSLKLRAYTRLLDSTRISLHHRESYTDTLSGFLYSVRVSPFNLTALNQFLPEIASAKIITGRLDTLRIRAIARENIALGYINMHYRDLKIQYLNKGDVKRKTIGSKFVTFLANTLISKNNTKKTGRVYTERVREKAVIHYWIRMLLSGALTSAGIKDNKKQLKKYHKKRKKLHVPEIPDVVF